MFVFITDLRRAAGTYRCGRIDTRGALDLWDAALAARWDGPAVWVHGDMTGSNFLTSEGRLCGVLDFGCSAVGDPACDLGVAWTLFESVSRDQFARSLNIQASGLGTRSRVDPLEGREGPRRASRRPPRNNGTRLGWRWTSTDVIDRLVDSHCGR